MFAPESHPTGIADGVINYIKQNYEAEERGSRPGTVQSRYHVTWFHVIGTYTACKLTRDEDIFIALSGVAKGWVPRQMGSIWLACGAITSN